MEKREEEVGLLGRSGEGTSTCCQTLGNIIVSLVGTGVLGLPFAFRIAGWLAGSLGVILAALSIYYCMLLLVECRRRLETEESIEIQTYGDLGSRAFGRMGRYLTELLVLLSQCGGAVAYLVFIGQNLSSIFKKTTTPTKHGPLTYSTFIFLLVPIEIALSFIRSLSMLAPVSAFADACNILAMGMVVTRDLQLFDGLSERKAVTRSISFAGGVAVYCYEGFSITLALEGSMKERRRFSWVLSIAFTAITIFYICFGFFGYFAYGEETMDIITLNLPTHDSFANAVKIGLCLALTFTFPIMLHPVHEIMEAKLRQSGWFQKLSYDDSGQCGGVGKFSFHALRALSVLALAIFASFIPGFGAFISMVGSTVSALLAFVLPSTFHLIFMGLSLSPWQKALDVGILVMGLAFAGYGTYNAVLGS